MLEALRAPYKFLDSGLHKSIEKEQVGEIGFKDRKLICCSPVKGCFMIFSCTSSNGCVRDGSEYPCFLTHCASVGFHDGSRER